ncbi:MAG: cyclophilin-like fold protein [Lactobacillus delbrueckii]
MGKNKSVDALKRLTSLTIKMSMYGGFEQVGDLSKSIISDDRQTKTIPGDIVLYSSNQIVVFYGSNSWAYTKLGHINLGKKELRKLLSHGSVKLTLK